MAGRRSSDAPQAVDVEEEAEDEAAETFLRRENARQAPPTRDRRLRGTETLVAMARGHRVRLGVPVWRHHHPQALDPDGGPLRVSDSRRSSDGGGVRVYIFNFSFGFE